jgi:hypothetical protein
MATHTSEVVPPFDFRAAEALPISERFHICLERARNIVAENGYGDFAEAPCVPDAGASEIELQEMETRLGVPLPAEYRRFLALCRYLKMSDGTEIGGLSHAGLYVTEVPWLSSEHRPGVDYLVFANYWRYADGDQLMFDMTDDGGPVIAYLHEHGPLFEFYAPSFSLALWRLVHEGEDGA